MFQFVYTADRAGTYVAPESTALFQFMILAFPKHLRRLYLEVYDPVVQPSEVSLGQAPALRDVHLREDGVGLGGGTLNNSIFSELGVYACRFNNLRPITARTNKPSLNLTNAYLDTPSVGSTPDPMDYPPLPRLRQED